MNKPLINQICKAISLAMGIATLVLVTMKNIETDTAITLISIGLVSSGISQLNS